LKCRWIVRADGAVPLSAVMIAAICAAVRSGASRFNVTARSNTSTAVSGLPARRAGTSAPNPPRR
jgi:hypothetical protein